MVKNIRIKKKKPTDLDMATAIIDELTFIQDEVGPDHPAFARLDRLTNMVVHHIGSLKNRLNVMETYAQKTYENLYKEHAEKVAEDIEKEKNYVDKVEQLSV